MSIRIRVYVPPFADASALDERGFVEMDDGSTLDDLLKRLKVPLRAMFAAFCVVNYEKAERRRALADGDVVAFFSIVPGG